MPFAPGCSMLLSGSGEDRENRRGGVLGMKWKAATLRSGHPLLVVGQLENGDKWVSG